MSIKCDTWIRRMATEHRMIEPFSEKQVRDGVISFGVSSYGYGWTAVYDPGSITIDTVLVVETMIYSVPQDKLLWGGVSETTNPKSGQQFMADLIKTAIKEMKKQKLIS